MKKIYSIICIAVNLLLLNSCNSFLDIVPDDIATLDDAFSSRTTTERYLATLYSYMPDVGSHISDPAIQGSDEYVITESPTEAGIFAGYRGTRLKEGLQNTNSPYFNSWEGKNGGSNLYTAIRDCNYFLDNIDKPLDISYDERERWRAEAKFFKAYYHYYLLRMYGPIPLMKTNLPTGCTPEQARVFRDPFDDCVNYIVQLLDEAIPHLMLKAENAATEYGRITQAIAATLKAEVLVTAASPLFNGNPDFSKLVDKRGVALFKSTYDADKWKDAASACSTAIEICKKADIRFYKFEDARYITAIGDTTKQLMTIRNVMSKWNQELIWASSRSMDAMQKACIPYFSASYFNSGIYMAYAASFRMAELFYTENGIPIDEDETYDYPGIFNVTKVADKKFYIQKNFETAVLNTGREFRFYANLGFDGAVWFGNGKYKDVDEGTAAEQSWSIAAKRGQACGKQSEIRYSRTGYFAKKPVNFETTLAGTSNTCVRNTFPIMRLSDLYLMYAEALNETLTAPNDEVYKYIDDVRERSGLKGVVDSWNDYSVFKTKPATKEGMREIIRHERLNELAFEGKRFWDLRRWKEPAFEEFNKTMRSWNVVESTTVDYYQVVNLPDKMVFSTKNYLWPISVDELRANTNLVQNPSW